ncbi:MAG: hypothetical protein J1E29_05120, partial [Duncaniella sp.]|nr:hypothetical protein [Duncaniella sp.]
MKFKLLLACALLAGAVTTSCVDDIPGIDAKEQYTRDFVKTFGVFDPNQDCNIAKRATVNVTTTKRT